MNRTEALKTSQKAIWSGLSVLTMVGMSFDMLNMIDPTRQSTQNLIGPLTNYIGDFSPGCGWLIASIGLGDFLERRQVEQKTARRIALGINSLLFGTYVVFEYFGVGNTADLLDYPALFLGVIGAAALLELQDKKYRNYLKSTS